MPAPTAAALFSLFLAVAPDAAAPPLTAGAAHSAPIAPSSRAFGSPPVQQPQLPWVLDWLAVELLLLLSVLLCEQQPLLSVLLCEPQLQLAAVGARLACTRAAVGGVGVVAVRAAAAAAVGA